ncbi:MAG TPA: MFS transporter [Candidatus Limnocylindrales bacterium]|jgi:MFS family permease
MPSQLPPVGPGLDRTIRRNTITLAAALAIAWTVIQLQSAVTTITTELLTGQTAQAGVASALFLVTLGLVAIPAGRLMDRVGRGPVIAAGFALAAVASGGLFVAVSTVSLGLFLTAMAALGIGLGAATLARVGAADMAPPARRGTVIGRVLVGAAIGAILGPIVFAPLLAGETADVASLSAPWILAALIATVGAAVVLSIRHDPLAIARQLATNSHDEGDPTVPSATAPRRPLSLILRQPGIPAAFGAVIVAQGVMAIAMSVVGLEMHHHGQDLGAISVALAVHIVGMFGLSPVNGIVVDRYGRQISLVVGLLICAGGAVGLAVGATLVTVLPAIFFVGVGWNLAFLAGNARIADATAPQERAASLGALDMATLLTSASMTLLGPAFLSVGDLTPLMLVAAAAAALPAAYLARGRTLAVAT